MTVSPGRSASAGIPELPPARRRRAPTGGRPLGESTPHVEVILADGDRDAPPRSPWLDRYYGLDREHGSDGFLPFEQAATAMAVSVEELAAMVDRGWLSIRAVGSSVWVRPAAVSRMR